MKKLICVLSLMVFITSGFGQNSPKRPVVLPKDVIEFSTDTLFAIGGPYARSSEDGKVYSDGKECTMQAAVNCYGDKATVNIATGGTDFKKEMETEYNPNGINVKYGFKVESFGGGALASWASKFEIVVMDAMERATNDSYEANLRWTGTMGACLVQLHVTVKGKESVEASDAKAYEAKAGEYKAKAKAYLNEMIANAKKTDFTKL